MKQQQTVPMWQSEEAGIVSPEQNILFITEKIFSPKTVCEKVGFEKKHPAERCHHLGVSIFDKLLWQMSGFCAITKKKNVENNLQNILTMDMCV